MGGPMHYPYFYADFFTQILTRFNQTDIVVTSYGGLAKLVIALACHAGDHGFEPRNSRKDIWFLPDVFFLCPLITISGNFEHEKTFYSSGGVCDFHLSADFIFWMHKKIRRSSQNRSAWNSLLDKRIRPGKQRALRKNFQSA